MVQFTSALLLLSVASSALATECFFPAGNPAPNNVPCDDNAEVSVCCASKDQCLSNGLCRVNSDPNTTEFARGACTDDAWGPGCFPQCLISHPGSPVTNGAAVFECNSTGWLDPKGASYCCEQSINQKTGCCSGSTFWLPPGGVAVPISSASPAPASSTSSAAAAPSSESLTTVDTTTTTTAPCTTSTSSSLASVLPQNSTSSAAVSSSTSDAAATTTAIASTSVVPSNGTVTPAQPSSTVVTGAATKYSVAGVSALIGAFVIALF